MVGRVEVDEDGGKPRFLRVEIEGFIFLSRETGTYDLLRGK